MPFDSSDYRKFMPVMKQFQAKAPVDVVALAGHIGLNVWEDDLPEGISGKLFRDPINGGPSGFSIVVRQDDPRVRKRFTVAHELAHYLLHKDQIGSEVEDTVLYRSKLSDSIEREANRFAAAMLMPVNLIEEATRVNRDARAIAHYLQVSEAALKIRLGMPT